MTANEVITYVDAMMENQIKPAVKLMWINQIESEIQVRVLQKPLEEMIRYTAEDMDTPLIAPRPFDQLYQEYLFWQICQTQQEIQLADHYWKIFQRMYYEYVRHICETE